MVNQLIQLLLLVISSVIVMVLHELPKSMIYANTYNKVNKTYKKSILALYQYIDPIGLIFCVTQMAGFSKPYVYRLNDKKLNKTLGIVGFASLLLVFFVSTIILNIMGMGLAEDIPTESIGLAYNLIFSFFTYLATISMGMLLVNLFPVATFDMGMIIASQSSDMYNLIIKNDYYIKIIIILCMLLRVFPRAILVIMDYFLIFN